MSDGGKGSIPRPYSVDQKTFANNWEATFGKKKMMPQTVIGNIEEWEKEQLEKERMRHEND